MDDPVELSAVTRRKLLLLASSELSPLENSITPAFRDRRSSYNSALLEGLDFRLAETGRRDADLSLLDQRWRLHRHKRPANVGAVFRLHAYSPTFAQRETR